MTLAQIINSYTRLILKSRDLGKIKDGVVVMRMLGICLNAAMIAGKYILTTAVGALTTAVIVANMPWFSGRKPKFDLEALANAELVKLDGSNEQVNGRELWQGRGAVIMIVRRPG